MSDNIMKRIHKFVDSLVGNDRDRVRVFFNSKDYHKLFGYGGSGDSRYMKYGWGGTTPEGTYKGLSPHVEAGTVVLVPKEMSAHDLLRFGSIRLPQDALDMRTGRLVPDYEKKAPEELDRGRLQELRGVAVGVDRMPPPSDVEAAYKWLETQESDEAEVLKEVLGQLPQLSSRYRSDTYEYEMAEKGHEDRWWDFWIQPALERVMYGQVRKGDEFHERLLRKGWKVARERFETERAELEKEMYARHICKFASEIGGTGSITYLSSKDVTFVSTHSCADEFTPVGPEFRERGWIGYSKLGATIGLSEHVKDGHAVVATMERMPSDLAGLESVALPPAKVRDWSFLEEREDVRAKCA